MTPTPRTDAIAHRGLGSVAYIAEMTSFARQLEREIAAKDDEITITRSDQKRLEGFAKTYRLRADEVEDQLAESRAWSSKLADVADDMRAELAAERAQLAANHEATKLMGKWLEDERALADRLAGELQSWGDYCGDSAPASIDPVLAAWKEARSGTV